MPEKNKLSFPFQRSKKKYTIKQLNKTHNFESEGCIIFLELGKSVLSGSGLSV